MKPSNTQSDNDRAGLFARGDRQRTVPLLGVEVRAEVMAGHARAVVRQRYRNDETKPHRGHLHVPASHARSGHRLRDVGQRAPAGR